MSQEEHKELSPVEVLSRPAEEFVNDPELEMAWLSAAVRHMETYYKLITSVPSLADLKLTSNDDLLYDAFKAQFPDLNVESLTEDILKSTEAKEKWRKFCNDNKDNVEDFNFATMLRLNSREAYTEANTTVVPRVQFIAIEIARNRLGFNNNLPPPTFMQELLDELSSFLQLFSENNHLPNCVLKNFLLYSKNDNKFSNVFTLNWELKSSEKQQFDIRLLFNSLNFKPWWDHLISLCRELESFHWNHCKISKAIVIDKIHSVDILLNRSTVMNSLLSALSGLPTNVSNPTRTVIIKTNSNNQQNDSYFSQKRICLVASIIENLLSNFCTSLVKSQVFDSFVTIFNDSHNDWQHLFIKYENILGQSFPQNEMNNPKLKKALHYVCLLESYFTHLDLFGCSNESPVGVVIVVSESEFTRIQLAISLLDLKGRPITFKLVKVAGVTFEERKKINSFDAFKDMLTQESVVDDISSDNMETVVQTMLTFSLLTPKLNSPISKLVYFRNESIFIQYNLARIKSIIAKYNREYSIGPLDQSEYVSFSLLTNDHEWNLTIINLLRMQQINQMLIRQLTADDNSTVDFECNKILDQIKKAAHSFSCYYRNVKILTEPMDHLNALIKTRVKFCDILLKQLCFYFQLFDIATADRM